MRRKEWERPEFPKKAVITGGMPYGNKELHFGHVGGVFVYADIHARFMRQRIGSENVLFVSGTDCYGSTIEASYNKRVKEEGYDQTIEEYVADNYHKQKEVLEAYDISFDLFAGSAIGKAGEVHKEVSAKVFNTLYDKGVLMKLTSPQFYDKESEAFLNGRQVMGKCPIEGCSSDRAYADECELGHQYTPSELIHPISILSGKKPELVDVTNWYFDLEKYGELLKKRNEYLEHSSNTRKHVLNTMDEFFKPPMLHVKRAYLEQFKSLEMKLPDYKLIDEPKKPSVSIVFSNLDERDKAREVLDEKGIRFRTGKTLVPFRISGNVEWGIDVPEKEGLKGLTFWVWPESLWAPISFTKTYLDSIGADKEAWKDWWINKEAKVYQFIGEDNIYFYGIAEMGLLMALLDTEKEPDWKQTMWPHIIANKHILYMDKKASSSSVAKPPTARELLLHYTPEQLRLHFLGLGLSKKSVSFSPQAFMEEEDRVGKDVIIQDGNLLTNVLNRLVRSYFYTSQTYFGGKIPKGEVSKEVLEESKKVILIYEKHMYNHELHRVMEVMDTYIRKMSKYWAGHMKGDDLSTHRQEMIDALHGIRTIMILLYPIAPKSCENVRAYFGVDERIWDWKYIFETMDYFIEDIEEHTLKYLEPRTDFFERMYKKHEV